MIIIKEEINAPLLESKIINGYFSNQSYGFIDIETTGLSSGNSHVILIGLLTKDYFFQFFAETKTEEIDILNALIAEIKDLNILVNYNGTTFDIPFLNKRFEANNIDYIIPSALSFDLYFIFKKYGSQFNLPNHKLKTVEKLAGIQRDDQISGRESVILYERYIKNPDPSIKNIILLHNKEDILNLPKVSDVLAKLDIHHIMYSHLNSHKIHQQLALLTKKKISQKELTVLGKLKYPIRSISVYQDAYTFNYSEEMNSFELKLRMIAHESALLQQIENLDFQYKPKRTYSFVDDNLIVFSLEGKTAYDEVNHFIQSILEILLEKYT